MKLLFIPTFAILLGSCGEQASVITESQLEKPPISVSISELSVQPNSIYRPDLPVIGTKKRLNYTINGKLYSTENKPLTATILLFQTSAKTNFTKSFEITPSSGFSNVNLTSYFDMNDNIFYGSESSLSISDESGVIFVRSPLFDFANDAVFTVTLDSVVFIPKNSVKIGQSLTIRAYVSYTGNVADLKSVSYTGKKPDGSDLTPSEMIQTANKSVFQIYVPEVNINTPIGKYVRNFKAADRYGNLSNIISTEHSVVN